MNSVGSPEDNAEVAEQVDPEPLETGRAINELEPELLPTGTNVPQIKYQLAHEASLTRLSQQDGTLTNLRNRATGLFTVAALIASFSSTIGLVSSSHPLPTWAIWSVFAALIAIGICAMAVLWPAGRWPMTQQWDFGVTPAALLDANDATVRHAATLGNIKAIRSNDDEIKFRATCYSIGAILLIAEAALVVAAVLASR